MIRTKTNRRTRRIHHFLTAARAHAKCRRLERLPYSHKVLLENVLRKSTSEEHTLRCVDWFSRASSDSLTKELDFYPTRVMLHDVSGIPLIADLAAMREHLQTLGRDPRSLNPTRPVDFIKDHSVIVDHLGTKDALSKNVAAEFARNAERYRVAKWAGQAFDNVDVRAPGEGICHQINLEQLARVVWSEQCLSSGSWRFQIVWLLVTAHAYGERFIRLGLGRRRD